MAEMCFYVPGERTIQDGARLVNGVWIGQYSRETLKTMAARVPGVTLCEMDAACDQAKVAREAALCGAPVATSKEAYWEMLEVLPPCKWTKHRGAEAFFVSEALDANIHTWCVQIGTGDGARYWTLNRSAFRSAASIIDEVEAYAGLAGAAC